MLWAMGRVWLPWSQEAAAIPCPWDPQRSLGQGALIPQCCKVQQSKNCKIFLHIFAAKMKLSSRNESVQGIPTIWTSSFVRSMLSYQRTSQSFCHFRRWFTHQSWCSTTEWATHLQALCEKGWLLQWEIMELNQQSFLQIFGSFQHPQSIFVPIPNCIFSNQTYRLTKILKRFFDCLKQLGMKCSSF